ncbi:MULTISPECIES: hypothetical protein [Pseudoalteromonas]|uniref:Uncharacterized protein n=1 Tax=Pseudoalteromonas luteoviolacea (strain 2ta16) TaxID=1353533 RepID=V4I405_PSEL2|nr:MULTISPECIES: hypothetical protein [Pseudoalteromonas]ESP94969.1 hypothetical protein PL2TA16_04525 [Pseudoalteromonas luteoviolacea 2ta16]KZN36300.1 hypothetical protein N483_22580 [Pseudoalteromonas luteoviolacea NCIMB 1944]MCG7550144.1 hypothetical protein [Pseudoalteromonas sp. Of7M-16]
MFKKSLIAGLVALSSIPLAVKAESFPQRFMVFSFAGQTTQENDLKVGYLYFKSGQKALIQYYKFSPKYKQPLSESHPNYGKSESWPLRNYTHPNYDHENNKIMEVNGEICTDPGRFRVPNYSSTLKAPIEIDYTYSDGVLSFKVDGVTMTWERQNSGANTERWEATTGYKKLKGFAYGSDLVYMPKLSMSEERDTDNNIIQKNTFDYAYTGHWWLNDAKGYGNQKLLENQWIDSPENPLLSNISLEKYSNTFFNERFKVDRRVIPSQQNVHGITISALSDRTTHAQTTFAINSASIPAIIYQHSGFIYEGPNKSCYQTTENSGHLRMLMGAWDASTNEIKAMVGAEFSWEVDGFPIWGVGYQVGSSYNN